MTTHTEIHYLHPDGTWTFCKVGNEDDLRLEAGRQPHYTWRLLRVTEETLLEIPRLRDITLEDATHRIQAQARHLDAQCEVERGRDGETVDGCDSVR